jgi:anti-anti-sigma regulatory factor
MLNGDLMIIVAGEADIGSALSLEYRIAGALAKSPDTAIIDVSALTFCDLAGMDALETVVATARAVGVEVALHGESKQLAWMRRTFGPQQ